MTPSQSSIFQEVSRGNRSVLSSSSNLNSPTPQEQSRVIVGADDDVGFIDGADEDDGINEMDGTAEGTRFSSHGISIMDES